MNPTYAPGSRMIAGLIALVALGAVLVQFWVVQAAKPGQEELLVRAWIMLRYFTILSNLFVGLVMLGLALGARPGPDLLATVTLAIVIWPS